MSATGLDPDNPDRDSIFRVASIPWHRLEEFDRLMAQGGIEAVMEALRKEQDPTSTP